MKTGNLYNIMNLLKIIIVIGGVVSSIPNWD